MLAPYRSGPPVQGSEDERREIERFTNALYDPTTKELTRYFVLRGIFGVGILALSALTGELSIGGGIVVIAMIFAPYLATPLFWGPRQR